MAATPVPTDGQPSPTSASAAQTTPQPRVEYIAVTTSDELLEQIGRSLDGESAIRPVESAAAVREHLRPMRPTVLLLDATLQGDAASILGELQPLEETCVVVVFAPADRTAETARAIKSSAVFAVLPIPVAEAQTTAVLEGAREESLARLALLSTPVGLDTATPAPSSVEPPHPIDEPPVISSRPRPAEWSAPVRRDEPLSEPRPARGSGNGRFSRSMVVGIAGAAILATVIAWIALRKSGGAEEGMPATAGTAPPASAHEPQAPAAAPAAVAIPAGSPDELLEKARAAIGERRYTDPAGDNALDYYRAVLAQEPDNGEALEGVQRVASVLHERLQQAFADNRIDDAGGTLSQLRLIRPDDPSLPQLDAKLAEARLATLLASGNVDQAEQVLQQATRTQVLPEQSIAHWNQEIARHQSDARAQRLAQLASARIKDGSLVDPAGDNAKSYLAQLRKLGPEGRRLADPLTADLQQAVLQKVREAAAQSRRADVERWAAEARSLGVGPATVALAQRQATTPAPANRSAQESRRLAQLVKDRIADGRLLEPSQDSALFYLNALRAADPSSGLVDTSEQALSDSLIARGRSAVASRDFASAQASIAAARQLGRDKGAVDALERDIAAAQAPAPVHQVAASEFKRTRYVPPEYPKDALKSGVRGEVRVRITVDKDGKVKEATVVSASPAGIFDQSALNAVRRWRFKPIEIDGEAVEASATTNIVFQPDNAG